MAYNNILCEQLVDNISKLLLPGGRLLVTYLNGERIFEKLTAGPEWVCGKYIIRKKYKSLTYTGTNQKIEIKLPFSDGFYEEYLYNPDILTKKLSTKKIKVEQTGSFDKFLDKYDQHLRLTNTINTLELSTDDLEYIPLLEYTIYYKSANRPWLFLLTIWIIFFMA